MEGTCYYCEHELDVPHLVTFHKGNEDFNKLLCDECYLEWLESIKE